MASLYIFVNLLSIWINTSIWIVLSSSAFNLLPYHLSYSLWKTLLHNCEQMKVERQERSHFYLADTLKGSQEPERATTPYSTNQYSSE